MSYPSPLARSASSLLDGARTRRIRAPSRRPVSPLFRLLFTTIRFGIIANDSLVRLFLIVEAFFDLKPDAPRWKHTLREIILWPIIKLFGMTEFVEKAQEVELELHRKLAGFPIQRLPDGVIQHTLSFIAEVRAES